jgi:hypothetical protein
MNTDRLDLELAAGSKRARMTRSRGAWVMPVALFAAVLTIPGIAAASAFPITLPNPTGTPIDFIGDTFTIDSNCKGTNSNDCTLGGGPSGSLGVSWSVESILATPFDFTLAPGGAISTPAGTVIDFTVGDALGDVVKGNLAWTTWSDTGADTFLNATITTTEFSVTSLPGKLELGTTSQSPYYMEIEANCGTKDCVSLTPAFTTLSRREKRALDPLASVADVSLSTTPFGVVASTPEPSMVGLLACALAGLAFFGMKRRERRSLSPVGN